MESQGNPGIILSPMHKLEETSENTGTVKTATVCGEAVAFMDQRSRQKQNL